jgi:hypothetical protein
VQPADIAVELRPRSAWEAIDLGLAMLQRWWRAAYLPHAIVLGAVALLACALGAWLGKTWVALLVVWWLKPLYDRVVLHVLSRAVFGEVQDARAVLGAAREWLGAGLVGYLLLRLVPDMARSFALPVRQLEGGRGRAARARLALLGRRTRGSAVWLTVVCLHFEAVLYWSLGLLTTMLVPAKAYEARSLFDAFSAEAWTWAHVAAYAGAVFLLEPFYVAGGFALYLNRRTLLEGWDLEVALRRLAKRHGAAAAAVLAAVALALSPGHSYAQPKDPGKEIMEILKAPEFPHERDTLLWVPRERAQPAAAGAPGFALGLWIAQIARVLLWAAAIAIVAYLLWMAYRALPRLAAPPRDDYRPPAQLFGMALAPESLPEDVAGAAAALAREGRLREALALLYRGALSRLVHRQGVRLLASHTEAEVLSLAPAQAAQYLQMLIDAWRACAYARRPPGTAAVEALAQGYRQL